MFGRLGRRVLLVVLGLLCGGSCAARDVVCEGLYGGHLQGVAGDGTNLWWSFTVAVVKTDMTGAVRASTGAVASHHGDLCVVDGTLYVAVNLGSFNTEDKANSWVYAYDATTLAFLRRWQVPELVHGAGGMTWHDGRFYVVGGLPATGHVANYIYEYTPDFTFVARHDLPGYTYKGIQTAHVWQNRFWFGIYGETGNPAGRLDCAADFTDLKRTTDDGNVGLLDWDGKLVTASTASVTEGGVTGYRGTLHLDAVPPAETIIGLAPGFVERRVYAQTNVVNDFFVGGAAGATGCVEVTGTLDVARKLTLGRVAGSRGTLHLARGGRIVKAYKDAKPVLVGHVGEGVFELDDDFTLATGDSVQLAAGAASGDGLLKINAGATLGGVTNLQVATAFARSRGVVELAGGTVAVKASNVSGYYPVSVGRSDGASAAAIRGWGAFTRVGSGLIRIHARGAITADGAGTMHDLDLGAFRTVGTGSPAQATTAFANPSGTAGWYAARGGRLLLPHAQEVYVRASQPITCVGDYCYTTNATLVNAVVFDLKDAPTGKYMYTALYAPDRTDVPALPRGTAIGIWRMGLATDAAASEPQTAQAFGTIALAFTVDRAKVPVHTRLALYRWEPGTGWRPQARTDWLRTTAAVPSRISTAPLAPVADAWNIGWFALMAQTSRTTVLTIR